jgi:hypothetical protein
VLMAGSLSVDGLGVTSPTVWWWMGLPLAQQAADRGDHPGDAADLAFSPLKPPQVGLLVGGVAG